MRLYNLLITSVLAGSGLLCTADFAQTASVGVVGGTNLTDGFGTLSIPTQYLGGGAFVYSSGQRNFIIGPKLEVRFLGNLSVEVDTLHRNLQTSIRFVRYTPGVPASRPSLNTQTPWEFPLLARYRFSLLNLHPVVESGPSLRPAGTGGLSHVGITTGAGVETMVGGLNISPTVRYTHWAQSYSFPAARPDQVEALVGFDWPSASLRPTTLGRKLTFGAIAGIGLGDDFSPATSSLFVQHPEVNSPIFGTSIEAGLAKQWSLEVDALYRSLHGTNVPSPGYTEGRTVHFATLTWEFPVLLKYRFSTPKAQPFVELGPSFRAIGNVETAPPSHYGITGGTGVEFAIARLKVSPTARFTRWASDGTSGDRTSAHVFRNQAQSLLGIAF